MKPRRLTANNFLITVCILVFICEVIGNFIYGQNWSKWVFETFGFYLDGLLKGQLWSLLTAIFLHATPDHLVLNMIALFFFGKAVEDSIGPKRHLIVFFVSALAGEGAILIANYFNFMPAHVPTVGASAGIFGLMAAAVLTKPFEFVTYPYLIPLPLILVVIIYTIYNIIAFIEVLATGTNTSVAYVSHFGGLAAGVYFGLKYEGIRKGLFVLAFVVLTLIAIPFLWAAIKAFEIFNYIAGAKLS